MNEHLLYLFIEIVDNYESVEDIDTKVLEDVKEEVSQVLFERATMIDTLADMWDDGDDETEY